jgi:hypothetical protein
MWRNYVICVLIGLLLVTSGTSVMLLRQNIASQADAARLRQFATSQLSTQTSLQQQLNQAQTTPVVQAAPTSSTSASASAGAAGSRRVAPPPAAGSTPAPVAVAQPTLVPRATPVTAPVPTIGPNGPDPAVLRQIETEVSSLRGLQPKAEVPVQFLDQAALQRYYRNRFNQDYLPSERESDQKLLATLGIVGPNQDVAQILIGVLQEQILGIYNQDDKVMYLLANNQFGPDEQDTFAQEYDHALQDQYYDLSTLVPKHPDNDDQSLAAQALTEGDATLLSRLWAQQNLSPDQLSQLGQSNPGASLAAAPLFLREQLLFPYSEGFSFIRQIYQTSGYAGVEDVYRNPPQSTAQILHINKYRNHIAPTEVDLPDLSQGPLGDGWREINSNIFGELDLRLILSQLIDSAHGVRGADGWAGDRWELLEKDGRQALVIKSVWDTEDDATDFFAAFSQGMSNRFFGASVDEASDTRQALTAPAAATDVRKKGTTVVAVISFDRDSASAIADTVSS